MIIFLYIFFNSRINIQYFCSQIQILCKPNILIFIYPRPGGATRWVTSQITQAQPFELPSGCLHMELGGKPVRVASE